MLLNITGDINSMLQGEKILLFEAEPVTDTGYLEE